MKPIINQLEEVYGKPKTRTERQANKRKQIEKEKNDFDEYVTKLEEENERLKEENKILKQQIDIDSIIINFAKESVEFNG